jgi:hypothetical protein
VNRHHVLPGVQVLLAGRRVFVLIVRGEPVKVLDVAQRKRRVLILLAGSLSGRCADEARSQKHGE